MTCFYCRTCTMKTRTLTGFLISFCPYCNGTNLTREDDSSLSPASIPDSSSNSISDPSISSVKKDSYLPPSEGQTHVQNPSQGQGHADEWIQDVSQSSWVQVQPNNDRVYSSSSNYAGSGWGINAQIQNRDLNQTSLSTSSDVNYSIATSENFSSKSNTNVTYTVLANASQSSTQSHQNQKMNHNQHQTISQNQSWNQNSNRNQNQNHYQNRNQNQVQYHNQNLIQNQNHQPTILRVLPNTNPELQIFAVPLPPKNQNHNYSPRKYDSGNAISDLQRSHPILATVLRSPPSIKFKPWSEEPYGATTPYQNINQIKNPTAVDGNMYPFSNSHSTANPFPKYTQLLVPGRSLTSDPTPSSTSSFGPVYARSSYLNNVRFTPIGSREKSRLRVTVTENNNEASPRKVWENNVSQTAISSNDTATVTSSVGHDGQIQHSHQNQVSIPSPGRTETDLQEQYDRILAGNFATPRDPGELTGSDDYLISISPPAADGLGGGQASPVQP